MINLTDRAATVQEAAPDGLAKGQAGDGGADSSSPGAATVPSAPTGKPAPASINGVNLPPGATVVEDPELLRQILDATRKR